METNYTNEQHIRSREELAVIAVDLLCEGMDADRFKASSPEEKQLFDSIYEEMSNKFAPKDTQEEVSIGSMSR